VKEIIDARQILAEQLYKLNLTRSIYPSDANFLLVKVSDANDIYQYLCQNGVVVRNRSRVTLCNNCLRITVGSQEENQLLIDYLKKYDSIQQR
ncbi:MAG: aminotransferase class I/II-fold pyridoxal phosphate-dependent enzyme, partial [Muribaculaceae bacterium]|nr:aminotransferase class I/II-fold pyridoxal phosphate-dependent enzyme [Muribaculaceae bacterium]